MGFDDDELDSKRLDRKRSSCRFSKHVLYSMLYRVSFAKRQLMEIEAFDIIWVNYPNVK